MSYQLINKVRGTSTLRCTDPGTYTINLSDLIANNVLENVVTSAAINELMWSTSGFIQILRGANVTINLFNSGSWTNDNQILRIAGANNATANLSVVINTAGTVILGITKQITSNVELYQIK